MAALSFALLCIAHGQNASAINVFAAASLKEAFTSIATSYETAHPGVKVHLNFAGSQVLAAQINNGAPADVFASAAYKNLNQTKYDKDSLRIFIENQLTIVVRTGFPIIQTPQDLSKAKKIILADDSVPVGYYTKLFLTQASKRYGRPWMKTVQSRIVSHEQDVKAVLAKVRVGEADAGIVYVSDAVAAGNSIVKVSIPNELNKLAEYPVAVPSKAVNADGGRDFIRFLFTNSSQEMLEKDGFVSPLRAVSILEINDRVNKRRIPLPLSSIPQSTVSAVGHDGTPHTYTGASISALIGTTKALTATFSAADSSQQTILISDLRTHKAVLVRGEDGNYQLIVPGYKPSYWVQWVRRIDLK